MVHGMGIIKSRNVWWNSWCALFERVVNISQMLAILREVGVSQDVMDKFVEEKVLKNSVMLCL